MVAEQCRVGHHPIRHRQGRADPGQHQPRLSRDRARICADQIRLHRIGHRVHIQDQRLSGDAGRAGAGAGGGIGRRALCGAAAGAAPRHRDQRGEYAGRGAVRRGLRPRRRRRARLSSRPRRPAAIRRPDQHPIHVRHHRLSQGCDADAPQHPEQRIFSRPSDEVHRARPGMHSGTALSLLRHGDRQSRLSDPRRGNGLPERRL